MHQICTILFKKDNSDGWYYAIMSASENECKEKCEKLKIEKCWYNYKVYHSSDSVKKTYFDYTAIVPNGYTMHLTTDLIYMPDYNKWYFPEETIPCPDNSKKKLTKKFVINTVGEGDDKDFELPRDEEDFECGTDLRIDFGDYKTSIVTIAENIKPDIVKFIKRLKKTGYAYITNEEYSFSKILAWKIGNDRIRVIEQDYSNDVPGIIIRLDKIIPATLFYKEFETLIAKLEKYIQLHEARYKEYKNKK